MTRCWIPSLNLTVKWDVFAWVLELRWVYFECRRNMNHWEPECRLWPPMIHLSGYSHSCVALSHIVSGIGRVTCDGQWDFRKMVRQRLDKHLYSGAWPLCTLLLGSIFPTTKELRLSYWIMRSYLERVSRRWEAILSVPSPVELSGKYSHVSDFSYMWNSETVLLSQSTYRVMSNDKSLLFYAKEWQIQPANQIWPTCL